VKNMQLGMKIGLGFCVLLLITSALGAMAVLSMHSVAINAKSMAREHIPEVALANDIERHVQMLMSAMQAYALSENAAYWQEGLQELAKVKESLDAVNAHATQYPHLTQIKEREETIRKFLEDYEAKCKNTESVIKDLQSIREKMNSAGSTLVKDAAAYLDNQNDKFSKEIELLSAVQALQKRLKKIGLVADSLRVIDDIRIQNFKAQTVNDPQIMQDALNQFAGILKNLFQLKDMTYDEKNLKTLDAIQGNAMRYRKAMQIMLNDWISLAQINDERNLAAKKMMEESQNMALAGMDNVKVLSNDGVSDLGAAQTAMLVGLALALVLGVILSILIAKGITGPIFKSVSFAEKLAEGDLDGELNINQKDEIGRLADSLRKMVSTLKERIMEADAKSEEAASEADKAKSAMADAEKAQAEAVGKTEALEEAAVRLQAVAEITTSASEELSAQIEQSSKGAEQQAARVTETATAMEEMNATVLEVAKNASEAAEISDNARNKAQEGAAIVGQVVKGIGEVQAQALAMKEDMSKLGAQAEGIGQIMAVISDIADQTNLLALNAAIEAARAGEAGRGFAVVADEVRKLAEKTMAATKEVGDAIGGIQDGTRKNRSNVDHSVKTIGDATALATQSGEALNAIVHLVERTSDQVRAIAAASEEQSAASEEINRSIEEVNVLANESAESMTQAAQAVTELARQSQELKTLIEEMRSGDARQPLALA